MSALAVAAAEPGPTSIAPVIPFLWRPAPSHAYRAECLTRIGGYCMGSEFTASPQWLDCSLLDHTLIAVIMLFPGCF
jgi:hypothetical protein